MDRFKICSLFSLLLLLFSCLKEETIRLEMKESRLVLNAGIRSGEEMQVHLSRSVAAGSSLKDLDLANPGVIRVYVNDQFKGEMSYEPPVNTDEYTGSNEVDGYYRLSEVKPSPGDRVRLEAEADGLEPVYAEVSIPEAPNLIYVDTVRYQSGYYDQERMRVYITLKDKPRERNYYRIMLAQEQTIEESSLTATSIKSTNPGNSYGYPWMIDYEDIVFTSDLPMHVLSGSKHNYLGIFTDNLFDGKEYVVRFSFYTPYYGSTEDNAVSINGLRLRLIAVSEEYYNYYKQSNLLSFTIDNVELTPSKEFWNSYSNVENGFGLVFASNESDWLFTDNPESVKNREE